MEHIVDHTAGSTTSVVGGWLACIGICEVFDCSTVVLVVMCRWRQTGRQSAPANPSLGENFPFHGHLCSMKRSRGVGTSTLAQSHTFALRETSDPARHTSPD